MTIANKNLWDWSWIKVFIDKISLKNESIPYTTNYLS